jgi:SAM-dependent methyltransferase
VIPRSAFRVPRSTQGPWVIRCAPGLARVALAELRFRRVIAREARPAILRQRNHDLIFLQRDAGIPPGPLLRIPEEVHSCLLYGRYKISNAQLERLAATLRAQRRPFRLVVTADGAHFPRQETRRWLSRRLDQLGVRLTDDQDEDNVLWTFCIDEAYYVTLLRCSAADAPYRDARLAERPGSLPPTIAAAMAYLGVPRADDTVLDPVCGTGTLLAEAFAYAPEANLIGVDRDRAALDAARQNLAHIAKHRLILGDGTRTGLPDRSVTLFLANLPFGKQFGDRGSNPRLYGGLLAEMRRLAAPDRARAVLLSSDVEALEGALEAQPGLAVGARHTVKVRGEPASIFVVHFGPGRGKGE